MENDLVEVDDHDDQPLIRTVIFRCMLCHAFSTTNRDVMYGHLCNHRCANPACVVKYHVGSCPKIGPSGIYYYRQKRKKCFKCHKEFATMRLLMAHFVSKCQRCSRCTRLDCECLFEGKQNYERNI